MQAVQVPKTHLKKGPGKTGASRRGNTGGSSGGRFYWA